MNYNSMLQDLISRVHGDGGHRTSEVGLIRSYEEARLKLAIRMHFKDEPSDTELLDWLETQPVVVFSHMGPSDAEPKGIRTKLYAWIGRPTYREAIRAAMKDEGAQTPAEPGKASVRGNCAPEEVSAE